MIILQANKIERSFAGEVLFDNLNLQVDERDRIALVGKNGAGKSTLLKILVGSSSPTNILSKVDFPAPFFPTRAIRSLSSTCRFILSKRTSPAKERSILLACKIIIQVV